MIYRSKAPLRLGIAGGGTDVSPYCDIYGGVILNATINMYAYCTLEPQEDNIITFIASDLNMTYESDAVENIPIDNQLILHKGIYNRIVKDFNNGKSLSLKMITYSDAPAGSGLGSSSTMVVAILKAYVEWLRLPLGEYDIAALAYQIEREDLALSGGKQDQYAATFGGFNYMEFFDNKRVIVNPLRIKNWIKNELEASMFLYYTGVSRDSATIINHQVASTSGGDASRLESMHRVKALAKNIKESILTGDFDAFANHMRYSWDAKKNTSNVISNSRIDELYDFIMSHGGRAAKISGAGGGGFMMVICEPTKKYVLMHMLEQFEGYTQDFCFTDKGTQAWTIYD